MSCRANTLRPATVEVYDYAALDEMAEDESSGDDEGDLATKDSKEKGEAEAEGSKGKGKGDGNGKGKGKENEKVQAEGSGEGNMETEEVVGSDGEMADLKGEEVGGSNVKTVSTLIFA